jgi:RNA polymerase sigma-70 factor (ECF subfamily)
MFVAGYGGFNRQLTRRLGSADLASDVLQETYLRLEGLGDVGAVRSPKAYLYRIALNIAHDRRRAESRRLTVDEVDALLAIPDDQPNAARIVEDRSELNLLGRAIADLPDRRRKVLLLSRVHGLPHREIALQLGVIVRTVETDLKQAVEHCADRLKRRGSGNFGLGLPVSSYRHRRGGRTPSLAPRVHGKALERAEANRQLQSSRSFDP